MRSLLTYLLLFVVGLTCQAQEIAILKYGGGGDWYANLETSLPNLIDFCNQNLKTNISTEQAVVEAGSPEIFNYPFVQFLRNEINIEVNS